MSGFLLNALSYAAVWAVFALADRYAWAKWLVLGLLAYALQSVLRGFLTDCIAGHPFGWSLVLIVLVIAAHWWTVVGRAIAVPAITARLTKWKAKRGQTPAA